jgi:hypothetical protein
MSLHGQEPRHRVTERLAAFPAYGSELNAGYDSPVHDSLTNALPNGSTHIRLQQPSGTAVGGYRFRHDRFDRCDCPSDRDVGKGALVASSQGENWLVVAFPRATTTYDDELSNQK